jgi:hypothetical protein
MLKHQIGLFIKEEVPNACKLPDVKLIGAGGQSLVEYRMSRMLRGSV